MESGQKIGFQNINSPTEEKLSDEAFKREIDEYDILFLCETWLHKENINNLSHSDGYLCNFVFKNKRRKKGRPLGKILVYLRSEINNVVFVFDKSNENILSIKIGKNSSDNKSNAYIIYVYSSPKISMYIKENKCIILELIQKQLAKF